MHDRPVVSAQTWNRVARAVIKSGGLLLIIAVLAILVFIAREALPLFRSARAERAEARSPAGTAAPLAAGLDADAQLAFEILPSGVVFFRLAGGDTLATRPHPGGLVATAADFDVGTGRLVLGGGGGRVAIGSIGYEVRWHGNTRRIEPDLRWHGETRLDSAAAIVRVAGDRDANGRIAVAALQADGAARYAALDEAGTLLVRTDLDLAGAEPTSLVLDLGAALLAVGTSDGAAFLWDLADPAAPRLEDHIRIAPDAVTALAFLLGDQTLVAGTKSGAVSNWFRVRYVTARNDGQEPIELDGQRLAPGDERMVLDREYGRRFAHVPNLRFVTAGRPWTQIRDLPPHDHAVVAIAAAPRGRTFATIDASGDVRLHHATTGRTLVDLGVADPIPTAMQFAPKADALVAPAPGGRLHVWRIDNPHPEASLGALAGRTWYEGYVEPKFVWQSTGGSDEFEPKLGLVPLLAGTIKGTLYALLFSVPIAVLAALYVSQLASAQLRTIVKPVIELMAAMPSVVVGFLAALWLAPLLERNLGAAIGMLLALPFGLAVAIGAWYLLPPSMRQRAHPGVELGFLVPFLLAAAWVGVQVGGPLEARLFGGDLQQWLFDHHGVTYDQRNCIVVGIALGFAIVPIIFTISEDAMSAVPPSLTTAALALGASRWQSALHVVLPAASPGIFAAVMLGLGRAIGETMIVLMATGNTPILDFSPFNGMRTMSAGIAVEIPEAPHGGTLYRVLFLTGSLLFVFTFVLNTAADVVGRRLRKRYGQF
jgi:phosphate transport system permease protein